MRRAGAARTADLAVVASQAAEQFGRERFVAKRRFERVLRFDLYDKHMTVFQFQHPGGFQRQFG